MIKSTSSIDKYNSSYSMYAVSVILNQSYEPSCNDYYQSIIKKILAIKLVHDFVVLS